MSIEVNRIESTDAMLAALRVDDQTVEHLSNATVLITGGTGFLGSWIVETLRALNASRNANIRILLITRNKTAAIQRFPRWASDRQLEMIQHDVTSPLNWTFGPVNYIIHGATDVAKSTDSQLALARSIYQGTNQVLELAQLCQPNALMYMSSGSASPPVTGVTLTDEANTAAPSTTDNSGYAHSKRHCEYLVNLAANEIGFTPVITRGFSFVGPRMPLEKFAVGNFLKEAANGFPPKLHSLGNARRSYLYAGDAAVWYLTMLARGAGTYNVGSEDIHSLFDLASIVAKLASVSTPIVLDASPETLRTNYAPSTFRARSELGLKIFTDLETALMRTLDWIKSVKSIHASTCMSHQCAPA